MSKPFDIDALMAPRNVALIGASDRNWSPRVWDNLIRFGYPGKIFPINPRRTEIWGARCYASLADLPEAPDHLALFTPNDQSLDLLEEGARRGARSATMYAAGFGEGGDVKGAARAARLKAILDEYGVAAVGPNCMGLAVGRSKFSTFPDEHLPELGLGPVAALTQSGMLAQTISRGIIDAGLGLGYLVSCGNQTGLAFADYINCLARDPHLHVIACYVESVKNPTAFLAAARAARDAGKSLVVVKAGGTEAARKAALSHTGSLAGDIEVFDAFARDAGITRVDTLEDMVEAAEFFARARRPKGRRVCVMTNSGALTSLMTEAAEKHGVELARLTPETVLRLRDALPEAEAANPFDTKRTIRVDEYMNCVRALHDDPNVDLLLLAEEMPREAGIERKVKNLTALDAWVESEATKSVAVFSPLTFRETDYMRDLRAAMPHLAWMRDVGKTFRTLGRITASPSTPVLAPAAPPPERAALVEQWRARARALAVPTALSEADSKQLLAAYCIEGPRESIVQSPTAVAEAAASIGFPIVLKAVSAAVPHKSDAGLVLLNIADASAARASADLLARRCAAIGAPLEGILVAEQLNDGVEMVLGLHRDPEWGPVVMVGMGGVWLELFKDVAFAPPGLDHARAKEAIAMTRAATLLAGYRGAPPRDIEALAGAMVALGRLARELGDVIESIDVNPLLARTEGMGVRALDALVVLRPPT